MVWVFIAGVFLGVMVGMSLMALLQMSRDAGDE